jgi:hypothetical protein
MINMFCVIAKLKATGASICIPFPEEQWRLAWLASESLKNDCASVKLGFYDADGFQEITEEAELRPQMFAFPQILEGKHAQQL